MDQRLNVAGISITSSFALALAKLMAGFGAGSASVFAGGIHSGLDFLAAVLLYSSVNQIHKPADDDHRYGHGKYENAAAMAEVSFILLACALILYKSVPGMISGASGVRISDLSMAVMGVSALLGFIVWAMLSVDYRRTFSQAYKANCRHMLVNACSSLVIFAGLIVIKYTGFTVIDHILALAVVFVLLVEGCVHVKKSAGGILDASLPEREERIIKEVLDHHSGRYVQYHALRTRRSGPDCHVDLHLVVPRNQVIADTHELCDSIEKCILESLPGVNVLIHAEPCRPVSGECGGCGIKKPTDTADCEIMARPDDNE